MINNDCRRHTRLGLYFFSSFPFLFYTLLRLFVENKKKIAQHVDPESTRGFRYEKIFISNQTITGYLPKVLSSRLNRWVDGWQAGREILVESCTTTHGEQLPFFFLVVCIRIVKKRGTRPTVIFRRALLENELIFFFCVCVFCFPVSRLRLPSG